MGDDLVLLNHCGYSTLSDRRFNGRGFYKWGNTCTSCSPVITTAGYFKQGPIFASDIHWNMNGSVFRIGHFFNAVLSFVIIGAAVFFFVVQPANMMIARSRREPPSDPTTKKCGECLSEVPLDARRCAHCAQPLAA